MNGSPKRETFSSPMNTVLTMIGVAVGLGNVWRFPYMMGSYGGSAFLLVFLLFVMFFAIPAVMAEWALGRNTRKGPLGAFSLAFGPRTGRIVGALLTITVWVANAYYLLVIAYILYTTYYSARHGFDPRDLTEYRQGLGSGWLQYALALFLLAAALVVLYRGLNRGIERVSRWFLPYFGVVVVFLIGYALTLEGAWSQLLAFLKPDFAQMAKMENLFAAMGQAFFSLSLGGTFFLIYGSYLRSDEPIPRSAVLTGLGDAGAALLAALFIMPTILAFGLEMNQGPKLLFETLPHLFGTIPLGRFLGTVFLSGLVLVAFLSSVAALQVVVGGLKDQFRIEPAKAILIAGSVEMLLILPVALDPRWIGRLDLIFGSGMQVLGSALAILALTFGLGKAVTLREIFGSAEGRWKHFFFIWLRFGIPLALAATLVMYIIEKL